MRVMPADLTIRSALTMMLLPPALTVIKPVFASPSALDAMVTPLELVIDTAPPSVAIGPPTVNTPVLFVKAIDEDDRPLATALKLPPPARLFVIKMLPPEPPTMVAEAAI